MMDHALALRLREINERLDVLSRREQPRSLGNYLAEHMMLSNLRGLWPMSSADNTGAVYDLSEQGRTLSWVAPVNVNAVNGVPYSEFDGTASNIFRNDEAGLSITGSLTMGGWFYQDVITANKIFIGKWNETGNQRSYVLQSLANGGLRVALNSTGAAAQNVLVDTPVTGLYAANQWIHVAMQFNPSSSIYLWLNGVLVASLTTGVLASIFDSTAAFRIGAFDAGGTGFLDGRATFVFICAAGAGTIPASRITQLYQLGLPFFQ